MAYIYTYILSITPVIELRAAIPIGYLHYQLGIIPATLIGILGGISIVAFCMIMLPILFKAVEAFPFIDQYKKALLKKTQQQYSHKIRLWGEFFLVLLVALPLPGSGAFTGSLVAYLFGIQKKQAFLLISLGTIISALIVATLTLSGQGLWGFIKSLIT